MNKINQILDTGKSNSYFLIFIILISIFLRLHGIGMALPYFHFDGGDVVPSAYKMIMTHDLDYDIYKYGGCYFYITSILFYIYFVMAWIFKGFQIPLSEIINSYSIYQDTTLTLYYLSKYVSLFIGVSTILITYLIALKMFDRKVALLSSFLLAIHPLHIFQSQLANVDMCLLLWVLLSFYYSLKILNSAKIKYYILSSIFVGLSISTKYFIFSAFPFLISHYLSEKKQNKTIIRMIYDRKLILSSYVIFITFFMSDPIFFFDFFSVIKKPLQLIPAFTLVPHSLGKIFYTLITGIIYQIAFSSMVLNLPIFILFFIGLKMIYGSHKDFGVLILFFPTSYLLFFILIIMFPSPQYLLPAIPFITIVSSFSICENMDKNKYLKYIKITLLILGILFSVSDMIIPHYRSIINANLKLGNWIDSKIKEEKNMYMPNIFFPTTYLLKNDKFIYYNIKNMENLSYLGGSQEVQEIKSNLNSLNSAFITLVNPDFIITFNAEYLHSFRLSPLFDSSIYFKTVKELKMGIYKYKLIKEIEPPVIWISAVKYLMPLVNDYKFQIYQKTEEYSQNNKIEYINNLMKNINNNIEEIKFISLYSKNIKYNEYKLIEDIINQNDSDQRK